jgi:hypothetical protein
MVKESSTKRVPNFLAFPPGQIHDSQPNSGCCGIGAGGVEEGRIAACFRANEEVVLPPEGNGAHSALGGVVIEFEDAMVEIGAQGERSGSR